MIKIAIVEDDDNQAKELDSFIRRYCNECNYLVEIERFENADMFLSVFEKSKFNMIFMDIEMVGTDGMTASKLLRERDDNVLLIFVTNLSQYALKGYEVHAFDFIVKPINYYNFILKMERAFVEIRHRQDKSIALSFNGEKRVVKVSTIQYIEVMGHSLTFHTTTGNFVVSNKSMSEVQKQLEGFDFTYCNRCFFVNLKYVTGVKDENVYVAGEPLKIAKTRRNEFMRTLNKYFTAEESK